ncbi:hypothetical protein B0H19DRAFT_683331 [Mycena capillaripes]|nr:hypothetical protein B0H19DRAFT_683331 [Mycena capillaripes]
MGRAIAFVQTSACPHPIRVLSSMQPSSPIPAPHTHPSCLQRHGSCSTTSFVSDTPSEPQRLPRRHHLQHHEPPPTSSAATQPLHARYGPHRTTPTQCLFLRRIRRAESRPCLETHRRRLYHSPFPRACPASVSSPHRSTLPPTGYLGSTRKHHALVRHTYVADIILSGCECLHVRYSISTSCRCGQVDAVIGAAMSH